MKVETARKIVAGCAALTILILAWLFLPSSSTLFVHVVDPPGSTILVPSGVFHTHPEPDVLRVFPVRHGPCRVHIRFPDGQVVWASFFNLDVGARRRIDLFVERDADKGTVSFRQVINRKKTVFVGKVRASQTSADKPYLLDWL